jgi:hypothetical protein
MTKNHFRRQLALTAAALARPRVSQPKGTRRLEALQRGLSYNDTAFEDGKTWPDNGYSREALVRDKARDDVRSRDLDDII